MKEAARTKIPEQGFPLIPGNQASDFTLESDFRLRLEMAGLAAAFILPCVLIALCISMYLGGLFFIILMPFYMKRQVVLRRRARDGKAAEAFERFLKEYEAGKAYKKGLKLGAVMVIIVLAAAFILSLLA